MNAKDSRTKTMSDPYQPTLFPIDESEPAPVIVRQSDPDTSQDGVHHITPKLSRIKQAIMDATYDISPTPFTSREMAKWVHATTTIDANEESIRKRVKELADDGLLVQVRKRPCNTSGIKAATFRRFGDYTNAEPGLVNSEPKADADVAPPNKSTYYEEGL